MCRRRKKKKRDDLECHQTDTEVFRCWISRHLLSPYLCSQECLEAFISRETLQKEEGYDCLACKSQKVCATKKLTLNRCPPVLVVHLSRFTSTAAAATSVVAAGKLSFSSLSKVCECNTSLFAFSA